MAFDPVIGSRFGFTADDLEANRDGRLTDEQTRLLDATVTAYDRGARRAGRLVAVVFTLAIVTTAIAIAATPGGGLAAASLATVILTGVFMIVMWAMAGGRRARGAIRDRRLRTAEGVLTVRTSSTGTWYAHVGDARFGVELVQAQSLREDGRYVVHYLTLPDGAMPLSIEALD